MPNIVQFSTLRLSCETLSSDYLLQPSKDVAMAMASDVSAGQAEVFRQFEQQSMEQTAQASRLDSAATIANEKVSFL